MRENEHILAFRGDDLEEGEPAKEKGTKGPMREENQERVMTWMQSERNFEEEVVSCARCLMGLWFGPGWRTNGKRNCKTIFRKILILLKQSHPQSCF